MTKNHDNIWVLATLEKLVDGFCFIFDISLDYCPERPHNLPSEHLRVSDRPCKGFLRDPRYLSSKVRVSCIVHDGGDEFTS